MAKTKKVKKVEHDDKVEETTIEKVEEKTKQEKPKKKVVKKREGYYHK